MQLFHRGWDHHTILPKQLTGQAFEICTPRCFSSSELIMRN
ncbi:DUF1501 domain-containing protein [Verrucomicrobiales bacterium]|nr:DUF1501 domain-containing protein [Verrucomicrobiales bacterium]